MSSYFLDEYLNVDDRFVTASIRWEKHEGIVVRFMGHDGSFERSYSALSGARRAARRFTGPRYARFYTVKK